MRPSRLLAALALAALPSASATAAPTMTDINMVVALDRSESISSEDAALQITGLAYALTHPSLLDAIAQGRHKRIGLAVIKWSSFNRAGTLLPWVIIGGETDAGRVADQLRLLLYDGSRADDGSQTDVALGLDRGTAMLAQAPTPAEKQVINIVGDGVSNIGNVATIGRDAAVSRGITINALILAKGSAVRVLTAYFKREVIGGPTAFVHHTTGDEAFAEAMLRKMLVEIALLNALTRQDRG
jgi:hypothetical protein